MWRAADEVVRGADPLADELDERPPSQLRPRDHRAHRVVEGVVLSAHGVEHALDECDEGPAAADQRAQEQVQERSAASAARDDGALSQAWRQPGRRLPADASPDPDILCALSCRRELC